MRNLKNAVWIFLAVFIFSPNCSKKPKFYVKDKIYAPDELSLYFQAQYDIVSGRLKDAEEKLEFLIKHTEKDIGFEPYYSLAVLKIRLKKIDEAKIYAEKLTKMVSEPQQAQKTIFLFIRLEDQRKLNQVIDYFLTKFPSDPGIFRTAVINYLRQNNMRKIREICESFLEKNPNDNFALMIYGNTLKSLGEKEEAQKQFEKIIKSGTYDESVLKELINLYKEKGENQKAIELLKKVDRVNPSVTVKRELVELLLEEGQNEEAVKYMNEITQAIPEPEILFDWIRVLFRAKKYPDVVSNADSVMNLFNDRRYSDLILLMKAVALQELRKFEEAYEEYNKIDEGSEFYQEAIAGKIDTLKEISPTKAIDFIKQLDEKIINPQIAQSIIYAYREIEDYETALKLADEFEKRFESKRENFIYSKVILNYEIGNFKKALELAEKLLRENPDDPTYLNLKGYLMCEYLAEELEKTGKIDMQKLEEANKLVSRALEIKQDPYIKDSVGFCLLLKGDIETAERYIREALQELPYDAVVIEHLGDILLRKHEKEKALEMYKKALKEGDPKGIDRKRIERKIKILTDQLNIEKRKKMHRR